MLCWPDATTHCSRPGRSKSRLSDEFMDGLHSICLPEVGAMWTCADGGEAFQKLRPCGYVNGTRSTFVPMKAMRLGTLPIVAPTGGLKDTVEARTAA